MAKSNLMLDLDEYVRVTQETGQTIWGRYDGKDYEFPDSVPVDVHKAVATHVFGFMLPELSDDPRVQDKIPALQRLGWVSMSGERESGLAKLRSQVRFEEIPPFPTVLRLRQPEENSGAVDQADESVRAGALANTVGGGGASAGGTPSGQRKTLGLPKIKDGTQ